MARRKHSFNNDNYYHIFNRGVEKRRIFLSDKDYGRFLNSLKHYSQEKGKLSRAALKKVDDKTWNPVEVVAYCLMPNHFHLLIKQVSDSGVSLFMNHLANSYTKYFNTKYKRVGPLFQGAFKSVPIESDEQLIHLSRYIHLNPVVSGLSKDPQDYKWSSVGSYTNGSFTEEFIKPNIVLGQFAARENYSQFVRDQVDYAKQLEELKHLSLD